MIGSEDIYNVSSVPQHAELSESVLIDGLEETGYFDFLNRSSRCRMCGCRGQKSMDSQSFQYDRNDGNVSIFPTRIMDITIKFGDETNCNVESMTFLSRNLKGNAFNMEEAQHVPNNNSNSVLPTCEFESDRKMDPGPLCNIGMMKYVPQVHKLRRCRVKNLDSNSKNVATKEDRLRFRLGFRGKKLPSETPRSKRVALVSSFTGNSCRDRLGSIRSDIGNKISSEHLSRNPILSSALKCEAQFISGLRQYKIPDVKRKRGRMPTILKPFELQTEMRGRLCVHRIAPTVNRAKPLIGNRPSTERAAFFNRLSRPKLPSGGIHSISESFLQSEHTSASQC